jgi:hypothetical protein
VNLSNQTLTQINKT